MAWSPEMDIIDQLYGGDLQLSIIGKVFDNDRTRASRVLMEYTKKGIITVTLVANSPDNPEKVITKWELRSILNDEQTWQWHEEGEPAYWVQLTERGAKAFEDPDAWERLWK